MKSLKLEIAEGYCQCGCGGTTRIATRNNKIKGWIKGQHINYILGHNSKGVNHPMWKGGLRTYKKTKKGVLTVAHNHQREMSVKRGHPMPNYSLAILHELFMDCPVFNSLYDSWVASGYDTNLRPSFDRKDCTKPYTLDNLQLMTWADNKLKGRSELIKTRRTQVIMCDLEGKELQRFDSTKEAALVSGCHQSSITQVCQGKLFQTSGYKWKYGEKVQRKKDRSCYGR